MCDYHIKAFLVEECSHLLSRTSNREWVSYANPPQGVSDRTTILQFASQPTLKANDEFLIELWAKMAIDGQRNKRRFDTPVQSPIGDMNDPHFLDFSTDQDSKLWFAG
jgi:hypothetical protein